MARQLDVLDLMPPWDAVAYFQDVKEYQAALVGMGATLIVKADPSRVALILHNPSGSGVLSVSTKPTVTASTGIVLPANGIPITMIFSETAPLCQHEWWATGGGFSTVTVIEICLIRWPGDQLEPKVNRGKSARPNQRQRDRG